MEVVFPAGTLRKAGFEARDEIEDPLDEALIAAGLGEVTGAGSGTHSSILDVDFEDHVTLDLAVSELSRLLRNLNAPRETILVVHKPEHRTFSPYDVQNQDSS
jgi:hypothetical protein